MSKKWVTIFGLVLILGLTLLIVYYWGYIAAAVWVIISSVVVSSVRSRRVERDAKKGLAAAIQSARQEGAAHYRRGGAGNVFMRTFYRVVNDRVEQRHFVEQDGDIRNTWDGNWTVCDGIPDNAEPISIDGTTHSVE